MKKKKKALKPTVQNSPSETRPVAKAPSETADSEKQFDFGGIPDRNLKKNLGCG
jgi:hypothetical protein